jgi:ribosomal protein S18 acetylase RimI-like enzyme
MSDLIVKLYDLPDVRPRLKQLKKEDIIIRTAMAWDKHQVIDWVRETFGKFWASECDIAFARQPVSCYLATKNRELVGFACYDSSMKNFFGPVGVDEKFRGMGIGKVLLLECLHAMAAGGYAYAIVGDAGSTEFYEKAVNAHVIPGSSPGIYCDRLKNS